MNTTRLFQLLCSGLFLMLSACQAAGRPLNAVMVGSGDTVNGLGLATGAADAPPLWAFCSAVQESLHHRTFSCSAPVWQTLAVGHLFLLTDAALSHGRGADLTWELSIDDCLVDLESFGTFDYVIPSMSASPSPVREVFTRVTDWNLVMTNLNPGEHTLRFRAQNNTDSFTWLVNLVIEPVAQTDVNALPFPLHS